MTTWQDDAREFGFHLKQGDWRMGLLAARNVAPKAWGNVPAGRVSPTEFAKLAGTTGGRVMRYFDAWEKAADDGHVAHAVELRPGSEANVKAEKLPPWSEYYSTESARPSDNLRALRTDPIKVAGDIAKAMENPEVAQAVAAAADDTALTNVDIATSTETYLRRKREEAKHQPPDDAASHRLGGTGPVELSQRIHDESMEPRLHSLYSTAKSCENQMHKYGFRMALTDLGEFDQERERLTEVGKLVALFLDELDAADDAKKANETEGASR
jgi:hypothetical protein